MKHKPLTQQRSEWKFQPDSVIPHHTRNVSDGCLRAMAFDEPDGWHLSISFVDHRGKASRYPTWDEQVHAVRGLMPDQLTYAMYLPPEAEYVAIHDTVFHWHEVRTT